MSLSRLLASPSLRAERQHLANGAVVLPREVRELIKRERAEAYATGRADGIAATAAAELDAAGAVATALREVVEQEVRHLREAQAAQDGDVLDLAMRIARYVVDGADASAVEDVVRRIRATLAEIDDTGVVAHVHAGQADAVARALADLDVQVMASETIPAGDARLVGRWSVAEIATEHRWSVVQELLDGAP